ncbi:MAG: DUF1800 domain-containing protein [Acidobacteria bacterium]|nr:DUF1800 domain-containing protein [Acidobacteriota bacterium]
MPIEASVPRDKASNDASPATDQRVRQVLSRLTFGARPGDLERISKMGVDKFIAEQLDPDSIGESALQQRLDKLPTLRFDAADLAAQYNPPKPPPTPTPSPVVNAAADVKTAGQMTMEAAQTQPGSTPAPMPAASPTPTPKPTPPPKNPGMVVNELQRAKLLRAVYSERQLYEVMVDFWENHFSIFANKDADRWLLTGFDRDTIRPFALGRFRDLLGATAHSPAMLFYLDNWQSSVRRDVPATKDKPARSYGGINENYARELMELHTLGVDGGYSQKDVQEVARCFTGWTIRKPNEEGTFVFNPNAHDSGEKIVLGQRIPAGGGIADGERVLDILAKSPATARFVTTKLARRFLGDDPSPAVIAHASQVFLSSGGSIIETLKAIISSKDFSAPATYQNKVKTPFEYVASALRATNAETDANSPVLNWIARMGEPVYGRVTPDGYPDKTTEWLSNNDLLARLNFASALVQNQIKGTTVKIDKLFLKDGSPVENVIATILMDRATTPTRNQLEKIISEHANPITTVPASATMLAPNSPPPPKIDPRAELVALALGSPEFQHK